MIIRDMSNTEIIKHNAKTIQEFIELVIKNETEREKKFYITSLKKDIDGSKNIVFYYQDGILKSHHTSFIKFDYNDIIDNEIVDTCRIGVISIENIISLQDNTKEEQDKRLDSEMEKSLYIDMRYSSDFLKKMNQEFDEETKLKKLSNIKDVSHEELVEIVEIMNYRLDKRGREISNLNSVVRELYDEFDRLNQRFNWYVKQNK